MHLLEKCGILYVEFVQVLGGRTMKNISLIVWITQLGLGVAVPLAGFVLLGVWLNSSFGWGQWTIYVGIAFGLYCAIHSFITSLKTMKRLSDSPKEEEKNVAFNDHD